MSLIFLVLSFCVVTLSQQNSDNTCLDTGAMLIGFDWTGGMIGRPQNCVSKTSCLDKICQVSNLEYVVWVAVIPTEPQHTQETNGVSENDNCWAHGAMFISYDFNNTIIEYDLCLPHDACTEVLCNMTVIPNVSYVSVMPFL